MRDVLSTHMVVGMADVVHVTDAACARRDRRRDPGDVGLWRVQPTRYTIRIDKV